MQTPLNLDRYKFKSYRHQLDDTRSLFDHEFFGLLNEMGTGKTKTVIDAACELRYWNKINAALIIAPSNVCDVWTTKDPNPKLDGEIHQHRWIPSCVLRYHSKSEIVWKDDNWELLWVVTNYELIRKTWREGKKNVMPHVDKLSELLKGQKVFTVCDESSFIKDKNADQTKVCLALGKKSVKRTILNGTPMNNPLDLYSQMEFLDAGKGTILPYANYFAFRATFAKITTKHGYPKILGWQNLELLQQHLAPYVVRREKKDCLEGLPPKIYLPSAEVTLSEKTWAIYKDMRDEAVVWLDKNPSLASQATVKVLRLMQITSGFLGGVIELDDPEEELLLADGVTKERVTKTEEIGREKLDFLMDRVSKLLITKPGLKMIAWCWFRPELERVARELKALLPTYRIYGQSETERKEAERGFKGDPGPGLLAGQQRSGGFGLNLQVSDTVEYLSNYHSLIVRQQSEDRAHRSGQTRPVSYQDVLAVGPKGQKTVDHQVLKHLRDGENLASWTCAAWKRALLEE